MKTIKIFNVIYTNINITKITIEVVCFVSIDLTGLNMRRIIKHQLTKLGLESILDLLKHTNTGDLY